MITGLSAADGEQPTPSSEAVRPQRTTAGPAIPGLSEAAAPRTARDQAEAAAWSASTRSVRSQVKSGSSRPKWPYAAVRA